MLKNCLGNRFWFFFWKKISKNMGDTEKIIMSNIVGHKIIYKMAMNIFFLSPINLEIFTQKTSQIFLVISPLPLVQFHSSFNLDLQIVFPVLGTNFVKIAALTPLLQFLTFFGHTSGTTCPMFLIFDLRPANLAFYMMYKFH